MRNKLSLEYLFVILYQIFIVAYVMKNEKKEENKRKRQNKLHHVGFEHTKNWNSKPRPYPLGHRLLWKIVHITDI